MLVILSVQGFAQVRITAIPSKTIIARNETLQLQWMVEGMMEAEELQFPAFNGFTEAAASTVHNGWTWVDGSLKAFVSHTFFLKPQREGKIQIPAATLYYKGRIYISNSLMILVLPAAAAGTDSGAKLKLVTELLSGEKAEDKISNHLFLVAEVDKKEVTVGEPLMASFKLYTRLESSSRVERRPAFNGFTVIDMEEPEAGKFHPEVYKGETFNAYTIRKVQLYPLQPGSFVIEPLEVVNTVRFYRKQGRGTSPQRETEKWMDAVQARMEAAEGLPEVHSTRLSTPAVKVNVRPLPALMQPPGFSGAVGQFSIRTSLVQPRIQLTENTVLRVEISGSGNFPVITAPEIALPVGLELFEPSVKEQFDKSRHPIAGSRQFDFPLVANKPGNYAIPSVAFSYYDYKSGNYKITRSLPLQLQVNKTKSRGNDADNKPVTTASSRWLLMIASIIAAAILLFVWKSRNKAEQEDDTEMEVTGKRTPHVQTAVDVLLANAFSAIAHGRDKQFFACIMEAWLQFFEERTGIPAAEKHIKKIVRYLCDEAELPAQAQQLNDVFTTCERCLFTPIHETLHRETFLRQTESLMHELNAQLKMKAEK